MYSVSSKKITAMIFAGLKNKAEMASKNKIVVAMVSPPVVWEKVRRVCRYNFRKDEVQQKIVGVASNVWAAHPKVNLTNCYFEALRLVALV